jgi:hypothetical protein
MAPTILLNSVSDKQKRQELNFPVCNKLRKKGEIMKKVVGSIVFIALLGLAVSFVGSHLVSAAPAEAESFLGCYVRISEAGDYVYDEECKAHQVFKTDADGQVVINTYQDYAQTSWHPETAFRDSYEACFNFGPPSGVKCGTINELITPSGQYKSSFHLY